MDNYTQKTKNVIKKFASFFANQNIDAKFKELTNDIFANQFPNYKDIVVDNKEFADLRIALLENGKIQQLFPKLPTNNNKEKEHADSVLLNFIAFEATALPKFLKKENYIFEDLKEFINITYRPLENKSGCENILSASFNITMFVFSDKRFEYVIKPNIQYVLSPEMKVNESAVMKLL